MHRVPPAFNFDFDMDTTADAYPQFPMLPPHFLDIANLMFLAGHLPLPSPGPFQTRGSRRRKKGRDPRANATSIACKHVELQSHTLDFLKYRSPTNLRGDRELLEKVSEILMNTTLEEQQTRQNDDVKAVISWLLSYGDNVFNEACTASADTSLIVQKCIELALPHDRALLREHLRGKVLTLMTDKNGNYVVTKLLDVDCRALVEGRHPWPAAFFFEEIHGCAVHLAKKALGSRLIQRLVSYGAACPEATPVLEELSGQIKSLCKDNYGNYIVQTMIQEKSTFTDGVVQQVMGEKGPLARNRGGSRVLQAALEQAPPEVAVEIFDLFKTDSAFSLDEIDSMTSNTFGRFLVEQIMKVPGTCSALPDAPVSDLVRDAQERFRACLAGRGAGEV